MTKQNNAAIEAVKAAACLDESPVDLHKEYNLNAHCGYARDLRLPESEAQSLASRLRGANAVTAILMTEGAENVSLGGYLRGGLLDALHCLIGDAMAALEHANDEASKGDTA